MPKQEPEAIIFFADLHMGGDGQLDHFSSVAELVRALEELDTRYDYFELVFVGDTFELWLQTPNTNKSKVDTLASTQKYRPFFNKIKQLSKRHKLRILVGNHDNEISFSDKEQQSLRNWGFDVTRQNCLYYQKSLGGKENFIIYGEHGNQFDSQNKYEDYSNPLESPIGYHIASEMVNSVASLRRENKSSWLSYLHVVKPYESAVKWFLSNYFYRELSSFLKWVAVPISLGYIATRILFIVLALHLLGFITFKLEILPLVAKIILGIIVAIDLFLILLGIVAYIIKLDFRKFLFRHGVNAFGQLTNTRRYEQQNYLFGLLRGEKPKLGNPDHIDLMISGHNHSASLRTINVDGHRIYYANPGTWVLRMLEQKARFRLPNLWIPWYRLTYFVVVPEKNRVVMELHQQSHTYGVKLTWIQKIAAFGMGVPRRVTRRRRLVKRIIHNYT